MKERKNISLHIKALYSDSKSFGATVREYLTVQNIGSSA